MGGVRLGLYVFGVNIMEKLGLIDHLMYMADRHNIAPLIMSGAMVLGPSGDEEHLDADKIAEHLAARMQKIPMLRKRFVQDPLHLGSVKKVDEPDFDVWDHVDVIHLPSPGNYDQLCAAVAAYANQPFGLQEVFEFLIIGGVEGGRLALASKIHHAFVDGIGAAELMKSVFDEQPVPLEKVRGRGRHRSASVPTAFKLTLDAIGENLDRVFRKLPSVVYKTAPSAYASLSTVVKNRLSGTGEAQDKKADDRPECKPTSLNHIANDRGFRTLSYKVFSLNELKAMAKQFECTVNDLALVLFSRALERYFESTGENIDFDLVVAMPISLRGTSQVSGGNQITAAFITLHNTEPDLLKRLKKINTETRKAKSDMRPENPGNAVEMEELAELIPPPIIDLALYIADKGRLMDRMASKLAFLNAFLTNVPGYPVTTYLGNAQLEYGIPMIPAVPMLALSPGVTSSGDTFVFGFNCDGSVVSDAQVLVEGLNRGLSELRALANSEVKSQAKNRTRPSKRQKVTRVTAGNRRKTSKPKNATHRRPVKTR